MPGIVTKIKNYIFFLFRTASYYKLSNKKKYAIVNVDSQLANFDTARYSYILCRYFQHAGFNIILKANRYYFRIISKYKKHILKEKYLLVKNCSTPTNTVVLAVPNQNNKTISLTYGYKVLEKSRYDCIAPYTLHPNFHQSYPSESTFAEYRTSKRRIQVLFAGNTEINKYNRRELVDEFNVMTRVQVIDFIKNKYKDGKNLSLVSDKNVFYEMFTGHTNLTPLVISEAKCDNKDWLQIVSNATFFLCPPGVYMPWCHNLIEAMAVGTIPILQYADLMVPRLKHLENCLTFSNFEELQHAIDLALKLDQGEVSRMKANVIQYYQNYLSIESIVETIKSFAASDKLETTVAIPFVPQEKNTPGSRRTLKK